MPSGSVASMLTVTASNASGTTGEWVRPEKSGPAFGIAAVLTVPGVPQISADSSAWVLLHVVEIELRVEKARATHPLGAKPDPIGVADHDLLTVGKGRLNLVMLVLGGGRSRQHGGIDYR